MGNDKGFITWLFTLISLILSGAAVVGWITAASLNGDVWAIILAVISVIAAIYVFWHGIMILIGRKSNTWLFVIVMFFANIIAGVLMLIAKIIN